MVEVESAAFVKEPVKAQDFTKSTRHSRRIYGNIPRNNEENSNDRNMKPGIVVDSNIIWDNLCGLG